MANRLRAGAIEESLKQTRCHTSIQWTVAWAIYQAVREQGSIDFRYIIRDLTPRLPAEWSSEGCLAQPWPEERSLL